MIPSKTLDALTEGREGFRYDTEGNFTGCGGEKSIDLLRLHYLHSSMKLELKTKAKISRNVNTLKVANQLLGTNYKRKTQALEHLESIMKLAGEIREDD
jgi:hypothetical protein